MLGVKDFTKPKRTSVINTIEGTVERNGKLFFKEDSSKHLDFNVAKETITYNGSAEKCLVQGTLKTQWWVDTTDVLEITTTNGGALYLDLLYGGSKKNGQNGRIRPSINFTLPIEKSNPSFSMKLEDGHPRAPKQFFLILYVIY